MWLAATVLDSTGLRAEPGGMQGAGEHREGPQLSHRTRGSFCLLFQDTFILGLV